MYERSLNKINICIDIEYHDAEKNTRAKNITHDNLAGSKDSYIFVNLNIITISEQTSYCHVFCRSPQKNLILLQNKLL
jgi:hypothetical protein